MTACNCGCDETKTKNRYYEEGIIVEYGDYCVECGEEVGRWSYGSYEFTQEEPEEDHT